MEGMHVLFDAHTPTFPTINIHASNPGPKIFQPPGASCLKVG